MSGLALFLLGPPRLERDGVPLEFDTRKNTALIAYLAVTGESHSREALVTLLWPELEPSRARAGLRRNLSTLRKALAGEWLVVDRETVGTDPSANLWLDVDQFRSLLLVGRDHGHPEAEVCPECLTGLAEAVELYRGDFLAGFSLRDSANFDEWQFFRTESLRQELASALERLVRGHSAQGAYQSAIPYARRWLALDPLHEPAHRHLMRLYAWTDQRAAALRQYGECERVLQEELGLSPEEETAQLYEAIKERRDLPLPRARFATPITSQTAALYDRYRLGAELGRGGMGVVYRAHDTLLARDVAFKVLSDSGLGSEGRTRLMHEARSAAGLNHPNIVTVHDVGQADGSPFIVMELVEGPSLRDHRPDALDDILAIARQICAALEHAHAHGIIHRDLKPENVLLAPDGTAKLVDFGLACSLASRLTGEGTITGTVFYMAPELALGQDFDGRADLYALGAVLYELTTGRLPFVADDPIAVITQHLHAPIIPPRAKNPQVPPALNALIVRLLSKAPEERPASATEVLQVLERPGFLEEDLAPAEELSVLERIERGRMVGRERELQEARALWNRALSGEGQVLLISGEPGIGKTRFVRELVTRAEVLGGRALVGASYAEGGTPYAPFKHIIREVLRSGSFAAMTADSFDGPTEPSSRGFVGLSGDVQTGGLAEVLPEFVLADLLTLAPELCSYYPDVPANPPLDDPKAEQHRLFENTVIFFSALSDHAPLLLVLEDAHWADSGTLSLLRHLARHTRQQRMMIVATHREVELDKARPLHKVLLDFHRERLATRLKLPRLDREQTRELLAVLFAEEITPEFLGGIYRETEGNPFFIEEVCKALVESGKLYYEDGHWGRPSMEELGIPQSVRVAIQSRVGKLPPDSRETLRLAAVLGRQFDFDTLAEASDRDEDALIDALESAERAQLIDEVSAEGGGTFAFVHGLIATTLVESMRALQRRRLHRRAAAAIEARRPDDLETLAYHYSQGGEAGKATNYLLKAGDRARRLYANQEAIDHYQQALALLKEQGEHEGAARTLMKLGLVHTATFEPDRARKAYAEAFTLWEPLREFVDLPEPRAPSAVLRLAVAEPVTLDPGMMGDDASTFIAGQLFEGLVSVDSDYNVLPAMAARWEVADRGTRYVFRLREGLRWNDGTPLSAADFEYAWKRNLALASRSPVAHLLYVIENARAFGEGEIGDPDKVGVVALDNLTLEIRLEGPTAYLPHLLAHAIAYPLPRSAVEGHGQVWTDPDSLVSNGAYQLVEWQRGERLVLGKNPFYHGRFPGNAHQVECLVIADFQPLLEAYAANALDAISMITADAGTIARARVAHGRELVFTPQPSTFHLVFRADRPPFDDVRVRRAFVHAVDREALARQASEGQYLPATGGFVPPGMPGHSPGIGLVYDPDQARGLLAQAGYPEGQGFPKVTWLYCGGSAGEPVVPFLRKAWHRNLGLSLEAQSLEWGAFLERQDHDPPHLALGGWSANYPDPDDLLRVTFHSTEGINPPRWHNARFDRLVEEAARVADPIRRMELYQQADRILVAEEAVIMPLSYAQGRVLVKPWVTMPRVPPVLMRLKHVVVQREEH
jgi:ABC-type oligopeptide transport system substrate-binding subunit/DNA-binding SARP family transcriptional activator